MRESDLPRPLVNHHLEGHVVDFHWPRHRVVVKIDGERGHAPAHRRERDHCRDADLQIAGHLVLRFTHRRLVRERAEIAQALVRTLPPTATG